MNVEVRWGRETQVLLRQHLSKPYSSVLGIEWGKHTFWWIHPWKRRLSERSRQMRLTAVVANLWLITGNDICNRQRRSSKVFHCSNCTGRQNGDSETYRFTRGVWVLRGSTEYLLIISTTRGLPGVISGRFEQLQTLHQTILQSRIVDVLSALGRHCQLVEPRYFIIRTPQGILLIDYGRDLREGDCFTHNFELFQ